MPSNPNDTDDWGRDPSIRRMRKLFSNMEEALNNILDKTDISLFDARIRVVKEAALNIFEHIYSMAASGISPANDHLFIDVYIQCLKKAFSIAQVNAPADAFPENKEIESIIKEVFPA